MTYLVTINTTDELRPGGDKYLFENFSDITRSIDITWGKITPKPELIRALDHAARSTWAIEHGGTTVGIIEELPPLTSATHF